MEDLAMLLARSCLAAVFGVAGLAKLIRWRQTRAMLREFGMPVEGVAALGVLLSIVEILTAILMIPASTAWAAGIGAVVLLSIFTAVVILSLTRGRSPACQCFGQLHSTPIGWDTVARNGMFGLVGAFIVLRRDTSAGFGFGSLMAELRTPELVLSLVSIVMTVVLVVEGLLLFYLLQRYGALSRRVEQGILGNYEMPPRLPIGSIAPEFTLPSTSGASVSLRGLVQRGRPLLLVFTDAACTPCSDALRTLQLWQISGRAKLTLAVISSGSHGENRRKGLEFGIEVMLLQEAREVDEIYGAAGTPSALVVNSDCKIDSALAYGNETIMELVALYEKELGESTILPRNGRASGVGELVQV